MEMCLRVLKQSNKSRFDSYSRQEQCIVLIISHITFRDCRVHIFFDNLSRNSCIYSNIPNPNPNPYFVYESLLRFSQTCELQSSKAAFTIAFFAAVNHNYDHKQRTLKHRNTQNRSKSTNHKSQTMTFWTRLSKVLFQC